MSKNAIIEDKSAYERKKDLKTLYMNKYFNLWESKFKSEQLNNEQIHYILKRFWCDGTILGLPIKHTQDLAFCPYTTQKYDMYDYPEEVHVINKRNSPLLPRESKLLVRNLTCCIGFAQSNHKPIQFIVESYINDIVEVEQVINTNLNAHKLPILLIGSPEEQKKLKDLLSKILTNEPSITLDVEDVNNIQALTTSTPFIIDKLHAYKQALESELLTYLGLDNTQSDSSKEFMLVDEINSNNALINSYANDIETNIKAFFKDIKETFNIEVNIESTQVKAASIYENNDGEKGKPTFYKGEDNGEE